SVKKTLGLECDLEPNKIHPVEKNLWVVVIENTDFISITDAKKEKIDFKKYLAQFEGHFGIVPSADLATDFLGIPTDVSTIQKMMAVVTVLIEAEATGITDVIIDVEPTAGLERLLSNIAFMAKNIRAMKGRGVLFIAALGKVWPEMAQYLKSEYAKSADRYSEVVEAMVETVKAADFFLVAIPEASPVGQTYEVRKIIEKFGGKVRGVVVNNVRGDTYESQNIKRLGEHKLPMVQVPRRQEFHGDEHPDRLKILADMGRLVMNGLYEK
ncbi:hypothetical protein H7X65_01080, partial [Candidatus Parcubacteria bacterium]|nr:hypothetical protein [Candidatus Parcubacteria bacterium]